MIAPASRARSGPCRCGHLAVFYGSFGFAAVPPLWPPAIAAKVADCVAHGLPDVVVLAR